MPHLIQHGPEECQNTLLWFNFQYSTYMISHICLCCFLFFHVKDNNLAGRVVLRIKQANPSKYSTKNNASNRVSTQSRSAIVFTCF